jgi:hypothetical protein
MGSGGGYCVINTQSKQSPPPTSVAWDCNSSLCSERQLRVVGQITALAQNLYASSTNRTALQRV